MPCARFSFGGTGWELGRLSAKEPQNAFNTAQTFPGPGARSVACPCTANRTHTSAAGSMRTNQFGLVGEVPATLRPKAALSEHLARIHDPRRIEGLLDPSHQVQRDGGRRGGQFIPFLLTYAVFG
jgi:hypothetical protein